MTDREDDRNNLKIIILVIHRQVNRFVQKMMRRAAIKIKVIFCETP